MSDLERLEKKLKAQEKTITALIRRAEGESANRGSAFAMLEQNIRLEQVVARRTQELEQQRVALERTLVELQTAQTRLLDELNQQKKLEVELRQAQKLEAVGRLAAGIAHEINTPVQFVSDSIHFVRDSLGDLTGLVDIEKKLLVGLLEQDKYPQIAEALAEAEEAADLTYLKENLPRAMDRALEGLARVATIVQSMKEFAHPDQREMTSVDLNRAIQNTLTIARNEYKYVADVETDFAELPLVKCHPGDINQVVLNIVVNAAHAIADVVRGTEERGRITVRTRPVDPQMVLIEISDTGGGIPENIRERIFEPFFTTKEVGRGTGQGLAISRSVVVDKHGGSLGFDTELKRGTTFRIYLPIHPPTRR